MSERFLSDAARDVEQGIAEYRIIEADTQAMLNSFDNYQAFDYIRLLQHIEKNESEEIKELLITYLIRSYRLALEWSRSGIENEFYKKYNDLVIDRINKLSQKSELFKKVRERGGKDS